MLNDITPTKRVVIAGCRDYNNYDEAKNYIDFYALDKSWMFFVGFTPDQAYQYAYTDASAIARAMNSYDVQITTSFLSVKPSEPLDLSHYYDDSIKDFLDHGAYLVYNPELIKEIMGKPVLTSDIPEFYEKLYEYWENSKFKSHPRVRLRQERYLKSKQICSGSAIKDVVKNDFVDDINTGVPDVIKSKYGIIDREGRWYNSDWGNHSYVASLIINNNPGLFNVDKATIDDALDIIVNRGYLLIRDVTNCHKPKLFHKSFIHPNSYQEDMIDKYLSHFNISESLEYETTYYY